MPPTFYNLLSLFLRVDGVNLGVRIDGVYGCASAPNSPMYQGARLSFSGPPRYTKKSRPELAYIDTLANSKIRLDSVKRLTQIQNTS